MTTCKVKKLIGILSYGIGNIKSLFNTITGLGNDCVFIRNPKSLNDITHLIIPGVGNYTKCMAWLSDKGWVENLVNFAIIQQKPLLGICLGMQILSDSGEEGTASSNLTKGLGFIPGSVNKLPANNENFRIPHIGWNSVKFDTSHAIFDRIQSGKDFYFAHSYHFVPRKNNSIMARTEHGLRFASIVSQNNVLGVQFHPEKSSSQGLQFISNFLNL